MDEENIQEPLLPPRNHAVEDAFWRGEVLFEGFDHGEIENGDYIGSRKKIEIYLIVGALFVICFTSSVYRDLYHDVGPWTAPIYEAEKYYFLILNSIFFGMFLHWFVASVQAYNNPRLIINHQW